MVNCYCSNVPLRRSPSRTCGPTPVVHTHWMTLRKRRLKNINVVREIYTLSPWLYTFPNRILGVKVAASRKLEHELGIPMSQTPIDEYQYLTRIHYLAPSSGLWGEHESRSIQKSCLFCLSHHIISWLVDYILFLTADVTVTANPNEIRDYKYVSKEELQAMFNDSGNKLC